MKLGQKPVSKIINLFSFRLRMTLGRVRASEIAELLTRAEELERALQIISAWSSFEESNYNKHTVLKLLEIANRTLEGDYIPRPEVPPCED
jgi:hypothetical protein